MTALPPKGKIARLNGCIKVGYQSEREARNNAKGIARSRGKGGRRMRPYLCPICRNKWHLTSQPKQERDRAQTADQIDPFLSASGDAAFGAGLDD